MTLIGIGMYLYFTTCNLRHIYGFLPLVMLAFILKKKNFNFNNPCFLPYYHLIRTNHTNFAYSFADVCFVCCFFLQRERSLSLVPRKILQIDGSSVPSSQFFSPLQVRVHETHPPSAQENLSFEQLIPKENNTSHHHKK